MTRATGVRSSGSAPTRATVTVAGRRTCLWVALLACVACAPEPVTEPETEATEDAGAAGGDANGHDVAALPCPFPVAQCDDKDPCTEDRCDPNLGCLHAPISGPGCEDGDACTVEDTCQQGKCVAGPSRSCAEDADPCTQAACDPAKGCVQKTINPKTLCDDGNPCTADVCQAPAGCAHTALNGNVCDDGKPCSGLDQCAKGKCVGLGVTNCDDGNACTADGCTVGVGCEHSAAPDGQSCDDGDKCSLDDTCQGGKCQPGPAKTCMGLVDCTSLLFDGVNGAVGVEEVVAAGQQPLVFAAWLYPVPSSGLQPIATQQDAYDGLALSYLAQGPKVAIHVRLWSKTHVMTRQTGAVLPLHQWSHVVAQRKAKALEVYVNGLPAPFEITETTGSSDADAYPIDNTGPLWLGKDTQASPPRFMKGKIARFVRAAGVSVPGPFSPLPDTPLLDPPGAGLPYPDLFGFSVPAPQGVSLTVTLDLDEGKGTTSAAREGGTVAKLWGKVSWSGGGPGCGPTAVVNSFCGTRTKANQTQMADAPWHYALCGAGNCQSWTCQPATGACVSEAVKDGTFCNDGDPCTRLDSCSGGQCAGVKVDCNDGSDCTADRCHPRSGACLHDPKPGLVCLWNGAEAGCAAGFKGPQCAQCADGSKAGVLCDGCAAAGKTGAACDKAVPAGFSRVNAVPFTAGCTPEQQAGLPCFESELPAHQAMPAASFLIQTHEVDRASWAKRMGTEPWKGAAGGDDGCGADCPATGINRWDAMAYANALAVELGLKACYDLQGCSGKAGLDLVCKDWKWGCAQGGLRLPTEPEWELAARAGTTGLAYAALQDAAWFEGTAAAKLHPIGQKMPNKLGLYDVLGNAWEWTQDCAKWATPAQALSVSHPVAHWSAIRVVHDDGAPRCGKLPELSAFSPGQDWHTAPWLEPAYAAPGLCVEAPKCRGDGVLRGCSWQDGAYACRVSYRWAIHPDARIETAGLRLVWENP